MRLRPWLYLLGILATLAFLVAALTGVGCAAPVPQPTPTPTVTPTPAPTPTPIACEAPIFLLVASDQQPDPFKQAVRDAQEALGDRCGYALADGGPQVESLRMLAAELRRRSYCAWQDEDRVVIQYEPGSVYWQEHHAVYWKDGCWLSNSFKRTLLEVQ